VDLLQHGKSISPRAGLRCCCLWEGHGYERRAEKRRQSAFIESFRRKTHIDPVFNLFEKNLLPEQRGNDVVHSGVIYEEGQSFDTVADCTKTEGAEYQKQNHLDLRVQLGINSWFPKSGFGVRTVLIEIDLSGRRLRGFGGNVFSKYDFQGFNCGRMRRRKACGTGLV
jgi:hypothetical protein